MGLYLCVFEGDEEVDGVEVGPYADFDKFRDCVVRALEGSSPGWKFPTLILHSDCDGEWSPREAAKLEKELIDHHGGACPDHPRRAVSITSVTFAVAPQSS
jgi:hypothetical protein